MPSPEAPSARHPFSWVCVGSTTRCSLYRLDPLSFEAQRDWLLRPSSYRPTGMVEGPAIDWRAWSAKFAGPAIPLIVAACGTPPTEVTSGAGGCAPVVQPSDIPADDTRLYVEPCAALVPDDRPVNASLAVLPGGMRVLVRFTGSPPGEACGQLRSIDVDERDDSVIVTVRLGHRSESPLVCSAVAARLYTVVHLEHSLGGRSLVSGG